MRNKGKGEDYGYENSVTVKDDDLSTSRNWNDRWSGDSHDGTGKTSFQDENVDATESQNSRTEEIQQQMDPHARS